MNAAFLLCGIVLAVLVIAWRVGHLTVERLQMRPFLPTDTNRGVSFAIVIDGCLTGRCKKKNTRAELGIFAGS